MLTILAQKARKYYYWQKLRRAQANAPLPDQYYFAFGANVQPKRFADNHMVYRWLGKAVITDYQLEFSLGTNRHGMGYGSILPRKGAEVWGVLYKLDETSLRLLDILEWVNYGYYRRELVDVHCDALGSKKSCKAWAYIATHPEAGLSPSSEYVQRIIQIGTELGYPDDYLKRLAAEKHRPMREFAVNHGFRISNMKSARPLPNLLKPLYKKHDALRQKLMELLP